MTQKKVLIYICSAFLLLCTLGIHGFSLPSWHEELFGTEDSSSILVGRPRMIRSDDWAVTLPMALAQRSHNPPFPVVNRNIGGGQNMVIVQNMPVFHPVALFRPASWGYFVGPSFGVAWHWWVRILGTACGILFSAWQFSKGRWLVAFCVAVIVTYSPFVQFWSANAGDMIFLACLSAIGANIFLFANRRSVLWVSAIGTGWAGSSLALTLYPPYIVPLVYCMLALVLSFVVQRFLIKETTRVSSIRWYERIFALAAILLILAAALTSFWHGGGDAIQDMLNTVYPGKRFALGGEVNLVRLFGNHALINKQREYAAMNGGNICESAGFLFMYPLTLCLFLIDALFKRVATKSLCAVAPVIIALGVIHAWMIFGSTLEFARFSGFSFVPGPRAVVALGILDAMLLLFYVLAVQHLTWSNLSKNHQSLRLVSWLSWVSFLFWIFQQVRGFDSGFNQVDLIGRMVLVFVGSAFFVFSKPVPGLIFLSLLSISNTSWFNPIVKNGVGIFEESPIGQAMQSISRADMQSALQRPGTWLIEGGGLNLQIPRVLGLPSLGGAQCLPTCRFGNSWIRPGITWAYIIAMQMYCF